MILSPLRRPTVPNAMPTVQIASAQPAVISTRVGHCVGGEVEVVQRPPQEDVAHRPADERELVALPGEQASELVGGGRDRGQHCRHAAALLGCQGVGIVHGH